MSKRAEEAALEAYPPKFTTPKRRAKRIQSEKVDTHAPVRVIFRKAYEQGQKETIEKAIEWFNSSTQFPNEGLKELIMKIFEKAMEGEK